jgi:hypothetical protein
LVADAIEAEAAGEFLMRQRLLVEAERATTAYAPAKWLTGQMQDSQGKWVDVDESVLAATSNAQLERYERQRASLPDNLTSHREIAGWCAEQGLYPQCRAHLHRILAFDPDNLVARAALGYQRLGSEWISPQQVAQVAERTERTRQSIATFSGDLLPILAKIAQPDERTAGIQQLKSIGDPAAVPAVEAFLASVAVEPSRIAVDWFTDIDTVEASQVLARYSLFHPSQEIRDMAVTRLKERPFHDYINDMLSMLASPVSAMIVPSFDRNGQFTGYRQAFAQEKFDKVEFTIFDRRFNRNPSQLLENIPAAFRSSALPRDGAPQLSRLQLQELTRLQNLQVEQAARELAANEARVRAVAAQRQNDVVRQRNARIVEVVSAVADREFTGDPKELWTWWDEVNETGYQQYKPQRYRGNYVADTIPGYRVPTCECFVAGTKVMTHRGLRSIELLAVGDTVLSRDVYSSELSWKPVLRVTNRPPEKTTTVQVGDDVLRCTTGHLFWVSGEGWKKASELKPGDVLHAAAEPMVVYAVRTEAAAPTFNLEVADNATYFVGESLIMTHDVTPRTPNRQAVPGQHFVSISRRQQ